jgi:hypothetical protein
MRRSGNKKIGKIKSLLDLIMKKSFIENEVEGNEDWQSAKGRYIRSKFRIYPQNGRIYDIDVGYTEVM